MNFHFASDNCHKISEEVLSDLIKCNQDCVVSYGEDDITKKTRILFKDLFGSEDVYFMTTGSAANVFGMSSVMQSHESIILSDEA